MGGRDGNGRESSARHPRLARRYFFKQAAKQAASATAGLATAGLLGCSRRSSSPQPGRRAAGQSGSQGSQAAPRPGGTLNAYFTANSPLDPQKVSAGAQRAIGGVLSRLFRFKTGADPKVIDDHDIENDLGVGVESPDAITWTVRLRPDARFQNIPPVAGHLVEAEDVKATFLRALDPATSNPNRGALGMMDASQIQTPDNATIVFKLNFPYAPFRKTLAAASTSWILPREALTGGYDPAKVAIGSGPFILDSVTPDVAYVYRKNPDWFEKGRPYVDQVRAPVIPDVGQQLAQFFSGNLDELAVSQNDLDTLKQHSPQAVVLRVEYGQPNALFFQMGEPSSGFQDVRVRRAFSMAFDRDAIGKVIYNGQAEQMLFMPAFMGKWALRVRDLPADIQQYYKFNPTEAKKLLEATGQTNLQLRIGYITGTAGGGSVMGSPIYIKHAETLANMLNAVGVRTTLVQQDYNKDFVDSGKGSRNGYYDKDMVLFTTVSPYTDADEWLFSYFHSKSTTNEEHLSDPTYDAMVDKQRTIVDENDRLKAVLDIERYVADKMYIVPTAGTYQWWAINPRVQNYQFSNTLGLMTETYAKLWLKA